MIALVEDVLGQAALKLLADIEKGVVRKVAEGFTLIQVWDAALTVAAEANAARAVRSAGVEPIWRRV